MVTGSKIRWITDRLKGVRKGTPLQNIRSKVVGIAQEKIKPSAQSVEVLVPKGTGRQKGQGILTLWSIENVRIFKK